MVSSVSSRPALVKIVEVGMRDGLQFEPCRLATGDKIGFIHRLVGEAQIRTIEVGSFVSAQFVPAMADTPDVVAGLKPFRPDVRYVALAPTVKYLERAIASGLTCVAVFVGATERFNRHNLLMSTAEALEHARGVVTAAMTAGVEVRGYVSVCWGGPDDPHVPTADVIAVAETLQSMGCYQISLGDTTASARPETVAALLDELTTRVAVQRLAMHFHDANGQALANIDRALTYGIDTVDTAVAGLGGCLASGKLTGNVATELVVDHLHRQGIHTGIDLAALHTIAQDMRAALRAAARLADDKS